MTLSSSRNYLIKDHLQGPSEGIKNWPGLVSRYKFYEFNNLSMITKLYKKVVVRVPIFYLRVGRNIRLGNCASWYKLVNGAKVSCHDTFC